MNGHKIITSNQLPTLSEQLQQEDKSIVLCHGIFDLLHPGHVAHLEEAKSLGDVLVVSVISAPYVNRGPDRPYFSDELRLRSLAALSCVDYAIAVESSTAEAIIDVLRPARYVKGNDHSDPEHYDTSDVDKESELISTHGGEICFTSSPAFSTTRLLNRSFPVFPPGVKEYAQKLASTHSFDSIRNIVDAMRDIKVLVVGDIIIDEYVFCNVQGITSKDRTFSARYQREECYLGGSLAVAGHLSEFSDHVTIAATIGDDASLHKRILNDLGSKMRLDLHQSNNFCTTVKRRYVERRGIREEYDKLLSVNYIPDDNGGLSESERKEFLNKLERSVEQFDIVVVTDFGHGLLDQATMDILQQKACLLAVNCQTNSSNFGTNLITKYKRVDAFTVDARELQLAMTNRHEADNILLQQLRTQLKSRTGWATLGSLGSVSCSDDGEETSTPALTLTVQDTVGAGDAFYALASIAFAAGAPLEVSSFLGNLSGAIAANILGNSRSVQKAELLQFASTLLKF